MYLFLFKTQGNILVPWNLKMYSNKSCFHLLLWKPFQKDGKYFLFHVESSLGSKDIWIFVLTCLIMLENDLIQKLWLSYDVTDWKTTIKIHLLTNILRSKGNHNEIWNNIRNIFFQKSNTKCGGEACPRHLQKVKINYISESKVQKCYKVCFYCMSKPIL